MAPHSRKRAPHVALILALLLTLPVLVAVSVHAASMYIFGTDNPSLTSPTESTYIDNLLNWINNAAKYGTHGVSSTVVDTGVTSAQILSAASSASGPALLFFVGHGYYETITVATGTYTMYYIVDNNEQQVYDEDIYEQTAVGRFHLVFLHSCYQGHVIGGVFKIGDSYYHYGMPQAWLHTSFLSSDGYGSPDYSGYVFIGWRNVAPFLSSDILDTDDTLYRFIGNFYDSLFGYYTVAAPSVNKALDYASQKVFGPGILFGESPLYNGFVLGGIQTKMVVYGDGSYDGW